MARPTAVLIGSAGKLPLAGMVLEKLHCVAGLQDLGYRVHYVERLNDSMQAYDAATNQMTDDATGPVEFLETVLPQYGVGPADYSFIDRSSRCHGSGWPRLRAVLSDADFVVDLGDATWFDELELCPRRAFIDTDPLFTQVDMLDANTLKARVLRHYDVLFTVGLRVGRPDCDVPLAGRRWIPMPPAVTTRFWSADRPPKNAPLTTLMNWKSGSELSYQGRSYGYKDLEFDRFEMLPSLVDWPCVVAMGGSAPYDRLEGLGWTITGALKTSETIPAYQSFIAASAAEFGIAKHAFVASRSGHFSDRSTCYLAGGRPVLHQDTGLADLLPTGDGLLLFSTLEEAVERLRELRLDYDRHAGAARRLAEEHFEAAKVMGRILETAGWR